MNRNRLEILLILAVALFLSGCNQGAVEQAGGNNNNAGAAASPGVNTASSAPVADSGANLAPASSTPANVAPANVAAAAPAPPASVGNVPQPGAVANSNSRSASKTPPAPLPKTQIGSGGNDFFIFTQARGAINTDAELQAANIIVEVKDGVVTLDGTVGSAALKSKAEQLVRGVGSKNVKNQLKISAGK